MKKAEDPRVLLAKDVIAALDAKRMNARGGITTHPYIFYDGIGSDDLEVDARKALKGKKCRVCAKGALLVAAVDRFNEVRLEDLYDLDQPGINIDKGTPSRQWLGQWFGDDQLALMEAAFEAELGVSDDTERLREAYEESGEYDYDMDDEVADTPLHDAVEFGEAIDYPDERLRAIMENVVKNNGEFIPRAT